MALPAFASLLLSGCAGFFSFDPPPERQVYTSARDSEPLPERPVGPNDYMVRKGDTMYSIAFRNQLDYRELAKWNDIGSNFLIYPGQVLHLYKPAPATIITGDIVSQPIEVSEAPRPQPIPLQSNLPAAAPLPITPDPGTGAVVTLPAPAASLPSAAVGDNGWQWPTQGVVVRGYNPSQGAKGLDFTGNIGQPVVAAAAGKVVYSGSALKGYGELVIIKHDELRLSAYGYNSKRLVKEGDVVRGGQPIAELGMGPENKPVLHFEIRERGKPINPVPFLPPKG